MIGESKSIPSCCKWHSFSRTSGMAAMSLVYDISRKQAHLNQDSSRHNGPNLSILSNYWTLKWSKNDIWEKGNGKIGPTLQPNACCSPTTSSHQLGYNSEKESFCDQTKRPIPMGGVGAPGPWTKAGMKCTLMWGLKVQIQSCNR